MSKTLRNFDVEIYKLKDSEYEYSFEIDDSFFKLFDESPVSSGTFTVEAVLKKSSSLLQFAFHIKGFAKLICDKSLEPFNEQISVQKNLIFKFGPENIELGDDIIMIERNTMVINIAQYLYEFIILEIPFRKIHPKFRKEDDLDFNEMVFSSENKEELDNDKEIDPRWKNLLNLKNRK